MSGKVSSSKESLGGAGEQKEAAGSYRSRGREESPTRKRAAGEELKEAAGSYRSRRREEDPARKRVARRGTEGSSRKL